MPTYKARSVTATLQVGPLQGTLIRNGETLKWTENAQLAKAVEDVLASGNELYERPIAADGSERGVVRFIGEFEDMACFMVEAGEHIEHIEHIKEHYGVMPTIETPAHPAMASESIRGNGNTSDASSPLTSLANTPPFGTPENSGLQAMQQDENMEDARYDSVLQHTPEEKPPAAPVLQMLSGFKAKQYHRQPLKECQSLTLTIEAGANSCPPKQDMKIEIFFNGALVDTTFINTKRYILSQSVFRHRAHGTRLDMQTEKPWVYRADDASAESQFTAEERWASVAASLKQEAKDRGCDNRGLAPPSAEYLVALSQLALPERLKGMAQSSIIDVIFTTGDGRKFTQNQSFISGPLRMSSSKFKKSQEEQEADAGQEHPTTDTIALEYRELLLKDSEPQQAQIEQCAPTTTHSSDPDPLIPSTSPDVPLARRTRSFQATQPQDTPLGSPPKKSPTAVAEVEASTPAKKLTVHQEKVEVVLNDLGLSPQKAKIVTSFKNRRGKAGTPRTVKDRVGDILKMNPENQDKAKQDLLKQLADEGLSLTKMVSESGSGFSPVKKVKAKTAASSSLETQQVVVAGPDDADVPMPDATDDPVAALAQARMDVALDMGVAPGGQLARRIESLSPHRQPVKRLGASSWVSPTKDNTAQEDSTQANSSRNTSVSPTKLRRGRSRLAVEQSDVSDFALNSSDGLAVQAPKPAPKPKSRSTTASGRKESATPVKIGDPTPQEAPNAFEIPEICRGGSVTYADAGLQRSVVRVRPGEFDEWELVVGMRFVVL